MSLLPAQIAFLLLLPALQGSWTVLA